MAATSSTSSGGDFLCAARCFGSTPGTRSCEAQVDGIFLCMAPIVRGVSLAPDGSVHARSPKQDVSKGGQ